jgi:hypothetical protein
MTEYHSLIIKAYDTQAEALDDASFDAFAKSEAAITIEQMCERNHLVVASEPDIVDLGVVAVCEVGDSFVVDYKVYPSHAYLRRARLDVWLAPKYGISRSEAALAAVPDTALTYGQATALFKEGVAKLSESHSLLRQALFES